MKNKGLLALLIAAVVAGALALFYQSGQGGALADWLAARIDGGAALRRAPVLQHGYYTLAALIAAWICLGLPGRTRALLFLFGLVFLTLTLCPVLALQGVLFEPFTGSLGALAAGLVALFFAGSGSRRCGQLARRFAGRLAREDFERLLKEGDEQQLTGRRQITALSCQLLNHAKLARELEPAEWADFASRFTRTTAEFLLARGGYLDEYGIHRVRVLFGFPRADENHAVTAARAALEWRDHLTALQKEMEERWRKRPQIGAALSSGEVATGLFGHGEFKFFSAAGEALATAGHLSALNAKYGSRLLVSAATLTAATDGLEVRPLEMTPAPESGALSEVYELLALKHGLTEEQAVARDAFWQGIILLRKGDKVGARRQFERAALEGAEDAPLAYFRNQANPSEK